jgi:hypothetical protein
MAKLDPYRSKDIASVDERANQPDDDPQAIAPEVAERLTQASQQQQQGELTHLYIDDKRYQLMAIFQQSQPLAIFEQLDVPTGQVSLVEWSLDETIRTYYLDAVNNDRVKIKNGDKDITMRIFSLL